MHAWSLHQPYALLAALGLKRVETRPRMVNHRGRTAIYATKSFPPKARAAFYEPRIHRRMREAGFEKPEDMPFGAIVGVVTAADCLRIANGDRVHIPPHWDGVPKGTAFRRSDEYAFGIYATGRTMTYLTDSVYLPSSVPATAPGQVMLWPLPPPISAMIQDLLGDEDPPNVYEPQRGFGFEEDARHV
jgi:hypothetical protein